ncbi:hypothetical protein B0J11DRAFT_613987 [Dendryphion nanum]|uniref:Actin-like ATPase domain-containing protein n=1 Tax=Dendryphion nanum TaxID=256645 RepID=A0A9P9DU05_9PLEO|nr:hypothetical protein B0J11DRAFT_613987 [Dendryphion nanum]
MSHRHRYARRENLSFLPQQDTEEESPAYQYNSRGRSRQTSPVVERDAGVHREDLTRPNVVVIGVDYGTTFSGIASTIIKNGETVGNGDINVFTDWIKRSSQKVPSQLSYGTSLDNSSQWGYDISTDNSHRTFRWTKLHLTGNDPAKELHVLSKLIGSLGLIEKYTSGDRSVCKELPIFLGKGAEDVVRDFLFVMSRRFFDRWRGQTALHNTPIDMVITHPVDWPYEALNQIYRAVRASFSNRMYTKIENVYLTTEPEAASLYAISELTRVRENPLIEGDCILICDAGGGTVDLASFYVDSVNPLKLTKVGELQGDACGATCIDRAFLRLLSQRLERDDLIQSGADIGGHVIFTPLGNQFLESFEKYKHEFSGTEDIDIDIPNGLAGKPGIPDSGLITITAKEMQDIFSEPVNGTLEMIDKQVYHIRGLIYDQAPLHVSVICIVGGLSLNPYFASQIKKWAARHGQITVKQPEHAWSAVSRGAVLAGAGVGTTKPPPVREAPRYYGFSITKVHEDWKDGTSADLVENHFDHRTMVPDPMTWLVRRGDLILPNEPITRQMEVDIRFTNAMKKHNTTVQMIFVAARLDAALTENPEGPPARLMDVPLTSEIVRMNVPLGQFNTTGLIPQRTPKTKVKYFTVKATIKLQVGIQDSVFIDVEYMGKSIYHYQTKLGTE